MMISGIQKNTLTRPYHPTTRTPEKGENIMKVRPMYMAAIVTYSAAVATTLCSKNIPIITPVLLAIDAVILGYLTCTGRWRC